MDVECEVQENEERPRILAVIDEYDDSKKIADNIEQVAKPWKNPEIYVLYVVDLSYLPSDIFAGLDRKFYDKLRKKGTKVLEEVISELKSDGFDAKPAGMYFGFAAEGVLRYEKQLRPDVIVIHERQQAIKKAMKGFPVTVVAETRTPVLIAK
ncbi:universal stress protein [Archaeoglobus veneficus]|uniref:UspA domain-containing protein n=1 Tax=Archaeoglobus veneficus (strain DSM 11195 / SNP6) TaxID=693661 RepID=F2KN76_ARCVS|nr:universal stress protein [Archaeoglobus veneficus]AEA46177.1 hypothetical protein Arcve_0136 [Archaeoglobus veneficus SNP6]